MANNQQNVSQDAVVHLVYKAQDISDIICPFSQEDYEILNADYAAYLDQMLPSIAKDKPVVMQITGTEFSAQEQEIIDRAIWAHYRLRLSAAKTEMRNCKIKTFWFVVSFILSSVLLYISHDGSSEVLGQLIYVPLWFFGYRMITFPIFDYWPTYQECKRIVQMASMHLLFTLSPVEEVPAEDIQKALVNKPLYEKLAHEDIARNGMVKDFIMEGEAVSLSCRAQQLEDIVSATSVPGHELLSATMACYIEEIEPFIKPKTPVKLKLTGNSFAQSELQSIRSAVTHHYQLLIQETQQQIRANGRKIVVFALAMILSCIALTIWGRSVDIVTHEFIIILVWFFADYLVEFALLEHVRLTRERRKWETIANMEITQASCPEASSSSQASPSPQTSCPEASSSSQASCPEAPPSSQASPSAIKE